MSSPSVRLKMAHAILNFEARRDKQGHLAVYNLPAGDGGGRYEVAGINERYDKDVVDKLVALLNEGRYQEAEDLATEYIASNTDTVVSWTQSDPVEFYLRDTEFNRGLGGAAKILQMALHVPVDGIVGPKSREALTQAESDVSSILQSLREAREHYERTVVGRDEGSKFWRGLVNRWNKALDAAMSFAQPAPASAAAVAASPVPAPAAPVSRSADVSELAAFQPPAAFTTQSASGVLEALRLGSAGPRVQAWQNFLHGQGFDIGNASGVYDQATEAATEAFQTKYSLAADGVAGRQTLLKAAELGFELIEEPAGDATGSDFPPRPPFPPLTSTAQRQAILGTYQYVPAPAPDNPERIRILGNWESENVIKVPVPQLRKALGNRAPATMLFHKLVAGQLQALWQAWDDAGLLGRVLTFDGSFVARFIRGSRSVLSNHAFGTAFDINADFNVFGARPPVVGEKGCTRELVPIANQHGFYWGGHFANRPDGMHFEVAVLMAVGASA